MHRFLSFALVLGALIGLFGQQAALASGPSWPVASVSTSPVSTSEVNHSAMTDVLECMETMADAPAEKPCTGLTLDCIAAMGCVVPMTLSSDQPGLGENLPYRALRPETVFPHLAGRVVAPEPEPPTLLI